MRGVAMDPTTRARARLWLRSEKALGQEALPLRKAKRAETAQAGKSDKSSAPAAKGEKSIAPAAPKSGLSVSIALPQAGGAMRQAMGGDSVDIFVAAGREALPLLSREEKIRLLAELEEKQVRICEKCRLAQTRTQTVFGEGDV